MSAPGVTELFREAPVAVEQGAASYVNFHDEGRGGDVSRRKAEYATMVNQYYDLATDFYEYGWGQSFHFASRYHGESFEASLARHEHFLALRLGLAPGMRVLDLGCGVGGPMRSIARFSGARVMGVNNNAYQIQRGTAQNKLARLAHQCEFLKADFMNLPVADSSYDAAYAIEALCHAPDRLANFKEILRVLKPGAKFAAYDWCLTERYDVGNAQHQAMKKGIEEGNALPDIATTTELLAALREAGFEVLESRDIADDADPETPWYLPLAGPWYTPSGFRSSRPGRWITHQAVRVLERVGVAPKGAVAVSTFLETGARALVLGGQQGLFTPMFYFLARKPLTSR